MLCWRLSANQKRTNQAWQRADFSSGTFPITWRGGNSVEGKGNSVCPTCYCFSIKKKNQFHCFRSSCYASFHEEPQIKLPTSAGSWKKQESSRKTSTSALLTMPKPLTVWITINCGKFGKRWEYQTTWPASWEICMQARKQQLELDVEQQTGSK